jgi:hypothetical protein
MTLAAVAKANPAVATPTPVVELKAAESNSVSQPVTIAPASDSAATSDVEPETILAETKEEKAAEQPETDNPTIEAEKKIEEEVKSVASNATDKGGEN